MAVGEQRLRRHAEDDIDRHLPVSTAAIKARLCVRTAPVARR
jgi:hypothetical protein